MLNNLQLLPKIQEQVSASLSDMQNELNLNSARLIEAVNQLNNSLTNIKDDLVHYKVSTKPRGAKPKNPISDLFRKLQNPASFFRRK